MLHDWLAGFDFGYTWPWTHGHLLVALIFGLLAFSLRRLTRWGSGLLALLAAWALAGFLIVQLVFGFNRVMPMPTGKFMTAGAGRVLDIGCGSGRTTIMLGRARSQLRISALDNFSADYIKDNGPQLLRRNLILAGIDNRVQIVNADMRTIPARDGEFDGVISSYAIDHLNRKGIEQTLAEVARVLRPGGEFLLMVIRADAWLRFTYGPLLIHQRAVGKDFWPRMLATAHLTVVESGTTPGSVHFLCRKN